MSLRFAPFPTMFCQFDRMFTYIFDEEHVLWFPTAYQYFTYGTFRPFVNISIMSNNGHMTSGWMGYS